MRQSCLGHVTWLVPAAVLALGSVSAHAADPGGGHIMLRSLDPPVVLPDGTEFKTWEVPCAFTRTYHVEQSNPKASDTNPGTKAEPFLTIARAADILKPGERVVVGPGVYREHVKPARGGAGPDKMISYEAAPGAEVIIKGSKVFAQQWARSRKEGHAASENVWSAPLAATYFSGYNPFSIENVTNEQFDHMSWAQPLRGKTPYTLPRGMIFQDGRLLKQETRYDTLAGSPGSYWVDRPAQVIHVHPFGGGDPNGRGWEITTERIAFGPAEMGLGFIRVKGFTVEQVGNCFPMQQEGAISTWRGHHWIIEGNTVRWVNGVGIDVGTQFGPWPKPETVGHHIVRGNTIEDVGVCGIAGIGTRNDYHLLIEGNIVRRAAYHDVERLYETAGIKTHLNTNCLIRGNLVADTLHGPGIWMDYTNANSRCCRNVVLGTRTQWHGGIFVEASSVPNMIDHNIIWDTSASGIYEHDSSDQTFVHNLIGRSAGAAILLKGKVTDRKPYGKPIIDGNHRAANNVFVENGTNAVEERSKSRKSIVESNLSEGVTATLDAKTLELVWSAKGEPPKGKAIAGVTHDLLGAERASGPVFPGPFATVPAEPTRVRLWPVLPQ